MSSLIDGFGRGGGGFGRGGGGRGRGGGGRGRGSSTFGGVPGPSWVDASMTPPPKETFEDSLDEETVWDDGFWPLFSGRWKWMVALFRALVCLKVMGISLATEVEQVLVPERLEGTFGIPYEELQSERGGIWLAPATSRV